MKTILLSLVCVFALALTLPARAAEKGDIYFLGIAVDQVGIAGSWQQLGQAGAWKDTNGGAIFNGEIYTTENAGGLWITNPDSGAFRQVGKGDFADTRFMFACAPDLYTIEKSGNLYRINPHDGTWKQVGPGGGWKDTRTGAVLGDYLYTIETSGTLWETELATGKWKQIGKPEFASANFLLAEGKSLYALDSSGDLTSIDPVTGATRTIGQPGAWRNAKAAVMLDAELYTAESDGRLFSANLKTGARTQLGSTDFANTRFMLGVSGKLCTIETTGNLYYVSVGKDRTADSFDWCPEEFEKALRDQGSDFYGKLHSKMLLGAGVTHAGVMDAIKSLQQSATPKDTVIIFIDAHGSTDPQKGWGIWTADKQTLWGREIKTELAKLSCQAIVFDETCNSGGFAQPHAEDVPVPPNVTALCACSATELANNQLDLAVGEALYGRADFNHDGIINMDELIQYTEQRYREWSTHPSAAEATDTPIIVRSKSLPGNFPLTRISPALAAVRVGDDFWSALIESHDGDKYKIHMLGWSGRPGDAYFLIDHAQRDALCLPTDGKPLLAQENTKWLPARLLSKNGEQFTVHLLGENRDAQFPQNKINYPFAERPE